MNQLRQIINQFVVLNDSEWAAFVALFEHKTMQKKHYFSIYGAYPSQFAFVKSGVLRAFYRTTTGEEYNKTFFTSGHFIGAYSSLVTGNKNLIDIQCLTPCELLVADYPSFVNLYDTYPKIERIARVLAEYFFVQKEKREIELVTLEAKDRYMIFKEEHPNLEQLIPLYHIASYLGISATQLSRIRALK